ncbi:Hsp70 family protein [Dactylosporangium sp. NPDC049525]|uniref:Hsp70 family protein n=1 Tax=Dactylosporangium sp. NPDC049525 TaxID=3154730 RepID=UPI003423E8B8
MRPPGGAHLGIDFGTTNTVAALRAPDGRRVPLLFDGLPLLPSAVFAGDDGQLLVGRDATHLARTSPDRYEPAPKRCIDDGSVLLGDRDYPVVDLVAAVLSRVRDEAQRALDGPVHHVTLTHPAAWATHRREVLAAAASRAGLPAVTLVPEPVAAARFLTGLTRTPVPEHAVAVVYDFGGGTFDATVLRMTAGGFTVLATEGLPDAGGVDVDAALVAHIGAAHAARDPDAWQRLTSPATPAHRRARRTFWDDIRHAKEMLSRTASTTVHLPLFEHDVLITRDQLELLARPVLDRTVAATRSALAAAGAAASAPATIFLVGGSSRIPLAATLLHRAFAVAPTAVDSPETVVAEGALLVKPA